MEYKKTVALKNGEECLLRALRGADAGEMLSHLRQTSEETEFLLRYPDEIVLTELEEAEYLEETARAPNALLVGAFVGGTLAASAGLQPVSSAEKCRHRAEFGISVKEGYWGLGVGSMLLAAVLEAAASAGYKQLELEVLAQNERALSLYRKFGFECFGVRKRAFRFRDGRYADMAMMQREI